MNDHVTVELLGELIALGELAKTYGEGAAPERILADLRLAKPTVVGPKLCRIADHVRVHDIAVSIESPTIGVFLPGRTWWEWDVSQAGGSFQKSLEPADRVGMLVIADETGKRGIIQPVLRYPLEELQWHRIEIFSLCLGFDLHQDAPPVKSVLQAATAADIAERVRTTTHLTPADRAALPDVTARFGQHFGTVPSAYYPQEERDRMPSSIKASIHEMPAEMLMMLCLIFCQQMISTVTTTMPASGYSILEAA